MDAQPMTRKQRRRQEVSARRHMLFQQLLGLFPVGRCVDLGTGHGSFARDAARMGWTVTAVDARTERMKDDPRIEWVQSDIRNFDLEPYDVILCLGLFYHLTLDDQLDLVRRASGRPLILDTHVDVGSHSHELSDPVESNGYRGRLYHEPGKTTSSWKNETSFWPDLPALHRMLATADYHTVLTAEPWYRPDRTFFLALPGAPSQASA